MAGQEPRELVSCGKCNSVNSVHFGLDLFECYNCGASVVISRASSSSCAASTALNLDSMQVLLGHVDQEGGSSLKGKESKAEIKPAGSCRRGQLEEAVRRFRIFASEDKLPVGEKPTGEVLMKIGAQGEYPTSPDASSTSGDPVDLSSLQAAEDTALRAGQLLEIAVGIAGLQPRQIAVGTAGPHLPAPDRSGHCRTSSASSRSQWALPDFSRERQIAVGTAGLQPRVPDRSGHCRASAAPDRSGHCRTSAATARSQWALPDFSCDRHIAVGTAGLQPPERMDVRKNSQVGSGSGVPALDFVAKLCRQKLQSAEALANGVTHCRVILKRAADGGLLRVGFVDTNSNDSEEGGRAG
eukprot:s2125_g9.t1